MLIVGTKYQRITKIQIIHIVVITNVSKAARLLLEITVKSTYEYNSETKNTFAGHKSHHQASLNQIFFATSHTIKT